MVVHFPSLNFSNAQKVVFSGECDVVSPPVVTTSPQVVFDSVVGWATAADGPVEVSVSVQPGSRNSPADTVLLSLRDSAPKVGGGQPQAQLCEGGPPRSATVAETSSKGAEPIHPQPSVPLARHGLVGHSTHHRRASLCTQVSSKGPGSTPHAPGHLAMTSPTPTPSSSSSSPPSSSRQSPLERTPTPGRARWGRSPTS